jgi:hypothetical protein
LAKSWIVLRSICRNILSPSHCDWDNNTASVAWPSFTPDRGLLSRLMRAFDTAGEMG